MSVGLRLIENVPTALTKRISLPFGLTAAASVGDAAVQKKSYGSGTTTLIFSNEDLNDITRFKSLAESGLLIKNACKMNKTKQKNKKADFLVCY